MCLCAHKTNRLRKCETCHRSNLLTSIMPPKRGGYKGGKAFSVLGKKKPPPPASKILGKKQTKLFVVWDEPKVLVRQRLHLDSTKEFPNFKEMELLVLNHHSLFSVNTTGGFSFFSTGQANVQERIFDGWYRVMNTAGQEQSKPLEVKYTSARYKYLLSTSIEQYTTVLDRKGFYAVVLHERTRRDGGNYVITVDVSIIAAAKLVALPTVLVAEATRLRPNRDPERSFIR